MSDKTSVQPGDRFHEEGRDELRVMAVCEGYALCRWKGAMPHVRTVEEIEALVESGAWRRVPPKGKR